MPPIGICMILLWLDAGVGFWEEDYRGEGPFSPLRIKVHAISMVITNAYLDHLAEMVLAMFSAEKLPSPSPSSSHPSCPLWKEADI